MMVSTYCSTRNKNQELSRQPYVWDQPQILRRAPFPRIQGNATGIIVLILAGKQIIDICILRDVSIMTMVYPE